MIDFAAQRRKMIDSQVRTEDVVDYRVIAAMSEVPRERFVPEKLQELAYIDDDLALGGGRALMRPAALAKLLQLLDIEETAKVLDVGCGTGYSTAVLARLGALVVGLELDERLAATARSLLSANGVANATVATGALVAGHPVEAPYDVIVLEGAVEVVPDALFAQLAESGRLVAVIGRDRSAPATLYTKTQGDIGSRREFDAKIPPLPGFERPKAFVF